jgi:CheY-like chemotaxis protein
LCASAFAVPADEILVREPESLLALTLEQSVTEAQSGCGRLAGLLREEFGESCSFQCSVLDLTSQQTAGDSVLLAKSNLAPVSLPAARRERKRLLVVDDERAYVDVIKEVLERAHPNFEVETATNGYEACVRYGAFDPDVVIFDIKMPGIDGVQAFKSMRSSRPGSDSKFLVAASESERIQEVMALGCHAYLPKPINYEELVNKVNALLAIPSATTTH